MFVLLFLELSNNIGHRIHLDFFLNMLKYILYKVLRFVCIIVYCMILKFILWLRIYQKNLKQLTMHLIQQINLFKIGKYITIGNDFIIMYIDKKMKKV